MKHKIIKQLDKRGTKTNFFLKKHKLSKAGFYGTIAGQRKDRKTIKALKKEGLFVFLTEEFSDFFKEFEDKKEEK